VLSLDWHPATWYQPWWSSSEAFALPSFYDGRVRVNLEGREAHGTVPPDRYRATLDRVIETVAACVDPATGRSVLRAVEWPADPDPWSRHPSDADLTLLWAGAPLAFRHPELGLVGPLPYRRTGGHTGRYGLAWVAGEGISASAPRSTWCRRCWSSSAATVRRPPVRASPRWCSRTGGAHAGDRIGGRAPLPDRHGLQLPAR
jgi:hypothetical protein